MSLQAWSVVVRFCLVGSACKVCLCAGEVEEYVHRVGRSARMGLAGASLLFLLPSELPYLELLGARGVRLKEEAVDDVLAGLPRHLEDRGRGELAAHVVGVYPCG